MRRAVFSGCGTVQPPRHHEVLALRRRVFRENLTQVMEQDPCYRRLVAAADVVVSLKEQPVALLGHPAIPRRPAVVCLHRSDPEHSGGSLESLRSAVENDLVTAVVCCARATKAA